MNNKVLKITYLRRKSMKKAMVLAMVLAMAVFFGCAGVEETGSVSKAAVSGTGDSIVLFNFESKTTDGWEGKGKWAEALSVNTDPKFVKEGGASLKINAKGSKGWNQDIATFSGPFAEGFGKLKAITMDVYVPKESVKGLEYSQIFLVISGSANSWYQVPQGLKEGWNSLKYELDSDNIDGDLWHMYFVFNSGGAFAGPVYIDNVKGIM